MRRLVAGLVLCTSVLALAGCGKGDSQKTTVGIVAPVEIPAMTEIIKGIESGINTQCQTKANFIVKNAQGDLNLQRSILQQYNGDDKVKIVVPIGTVPSEMAMTLIKNKPIVAIAADYQPADVAHAANQDVTNLRDDPSPEAQLAFIHQAMPNIKYLTLVHSSEKRVVAEVKVAQAAAAKYGITLQNLMIQQLPDIYSVSRAINPKSQGIYILQDETVVSGIKSLVKQAEQRHIPIIASDDGSVQNGAAFSIGVKQRDIGLQGSGLLCQALQGTKASDIPTKKMTKYTVFVNHSRLEAQNVQLEQLSAAAKKYGYPLITF
jgi:putative ABC transport system substrate-binding protein